MSSRADFYEHTDRNSRSALHPTPRKEEMLLLHQQENMTIPSVFIKDGAVYANSRDVAAFFEKRHDNVLADIRGLIEGGVLDFKETPYIHPQNGQVYHSFDMTRDSFMLLGMSFTGPRALKFKLALIAKFNAMEEELRQLSQRGPVPVPDSNEMEFVRLACRVKGERFASALWDSMGFYCPPGFEPSAQMSLFQPANQNVTISITHAA